MTVMVVDKDEKRGCRTASDTTWEALHKRQECIRRHPSMLPRVPA